MILVIDNYDSFVYNIVQYLREMAATVEVRRNDAISVAGIEELRPSAIVLSPGSGRPEAAGVCLEAVRVFSPRVPLLGVSLGHLAIGEAFGARVTPARQLMHGKVSEITCDGEGIFKGLGGRPFKGMRYHSLAIERASLPECLEICAESEDTEIMAVRHSAYPTTGLQFHPESIMTPVGKRMLRNFLKLVEA